MKMGNDVIIPHVIRVWVAAMARMCSCLSERLKRITELLEKILGRNILRGKLTSKGGHHGELLAKDF